MINARIFIYGVFFTMLATTGAFSMGASPGMVVDDFTLAKVHLRTNTETFNKAYYAVVKDGDILVKPNVEQTGETGEWKKLTLIDGLEGDVTEIALDDEYMIALNSSRQIYTMENALVEISEFKWKKSWGFPFWGGPGMKLKSDIIKWDWSVVSPITDENWTDPAGNLFPVGLARCSHIWLLNNDGQRLTYVDPWLPTDYSYEIDTPKRGTFVSVNLSTSGSYLFLINRYGDMYTRFYDFDIGGADAGYIYSYYDQSNKLIPVMQLPPAQWVLHPKIEGTITDKISIHKIGKNCVNRTMRVEGTDQEGNTGYYEKDVTEVDASSQWVFHKTGRPIEGTLLDNKSYDSSDLITAQNEDKLYELNMENLDTLSDDLPSWRIMNNNDWAAELLNFSCYNSPTDIRIHFSTNDFIDLKLHTTEFIRLLPIERGLTDKPRYIGATIEVPAELLNNMDNLSDKANRFIKSYLMKREYFKVDVNASTDIVKISGTAGGLIICWEFKPVN